MKKISLNILCILLSLSSFSQNTDINLLKDINVNRNQSLDPTFKFVTNSIYPLAIGVPTIILATGLIKKDSTLKNKGLHILETTLVSLTITIGLKQITKRERPFNTYPFIDKQTTGKGYSLPSGHTSMAFATATSLSLAFPEWYVIAPSLVWATGVGYSRLHLGVHYPSDVFIGAIIGAGSAFLTHKMNQWLQQKKHKKY